MIAKKYKNILVTGAAGFIGYHLCEKLIKLGHNVVGLDNINDYYNVNLKFARLNELGISKENIKENKVVNSNLHGDQLRFIKMNLEDQINLPILLKNKISMWYVILLLKQGFDIVLKSR